MASTEGKCHVGFDTPSMNYTNEYVRADLAQAPAPVRVKGLRWHNFDAWTHWAEGACGTYHVEERNGYWQVELRVGSLVHGVTETDGTTPPDLAAAKAAAQADYETRILAALEPDAGVVAELVEALRDLLAAYSKPDERICCNGHECGCQGATATMMAEHYAKEALAKLGGKANG